MEPVPGTKPADPAPGSTLSPTDRARIHEAAKQFEAVFVTQMLSPMFAGLHADTMFGGGEGEDSFRSVLLDEYGKQVAAAGGIGIAPKVEAEMIRIQERR